MLETRMGGVRDIVQELGLPHVLCFQARSMRSYMISFGGQKCKIFFFAESRRLDFVHSCMQQDPDMRMVIMVCSTRPPSNPDIVLRSRR